ncbi:MAG: NUDIX hydrolase [Planctomycetes bacterium]|nr:NUDIX hydrolase [Planctomycetota bacterium]
MPEPWTRLSSRPAYACRIFRLTEDDLRAPHDGRTHTFVRMEAPDWINVIALTPDRRQVVLIEQYRHGTGRVTLEIPGGQVDPGEPPLAAARRELQEETGYTAPEWHEIGRVNPNPAIQGNSCITWLALGAALTGAPDPDEAEDLAVRLSPLSTIPAMLARGEIAHALVHNAFFWLAQKRPDLWPVSPGD